MEDLSLLSFLGFKRNLATDFNQAGLSPEHVVALFVFFGTNKAHSVCDTGLCA